MINATIVTEVMEEVLKKITQFLEGKNEIPKTGLWNDRLKLVVNKGNTYMEITGPDYSVKSDLHYVDTESHGEVVIHNITSLLKGLKHFGGGRMQVTQDAQGITFTSGGDRPKTISLNTSSVDEYIKYDRKAGPGLSYKYNSKALYNRLKKVDNFRECDVTRPILAGVLFEDNVMVALDGFKLAVTRDNTLTFGNGERFVMAGAMAKTLQKILVKSGKGVELVIKDAGEFIEVETDGMTIKWDKLEGNFLNYKDILGNYSKLDFNVKNKDFKDNAKFIQEYVKDTRNKLVTMHVDQEGVTLESSDECASTSAKLDVNYEGFSGDMVSGFYRGSDFKIAYNNKYMLDIIEALEGEETTIKLVGNVNPIILEPVGTEDTFLLLPVRLS